MKELGMCEYSAVKVMGRPDQFTGGWPARRTGVVLRLRVLVSLLGVCLVVASASLRADTPEAIQEGSAQVLSRLQQSLVGVDQLLRQSAGVLIFPDVVKLGFGVGGQYGEGVLLVEGQPAAYYARAGGSFGLPLGASLKSEVVVFRSEKALVEFRNSRGWEVSVDAPLTVPDTAGGRRIEPGELREPVVGFILAGEEVMENLSFEGSKFTRIAR